MKIDRHDAWSRRMRKSADSKAIIGVQIRVCRRFTWDWASRPPSPRILTLDTLWNIIAPHSVFATRCEQNSLCLVAFINSYKTLTNLCWCEKVSGKKYYNALVLQNSALNTGCFLLVPPNSEKNDQAHWIRLDLDKTTNQSGNPGTSRNFSMKSLTLIRNFVNEKH